MAAGYQLLASVLPGAGLADAAGASRPPGRRRGKYTSSPSQGPGGIAATAIPPHIPAAYSRLAISISPEGLVNGLIKCQIKWQKVFYSWLCLCVLNSRLVGGG